MVFGRLPTDSPFPGFLDSRLELTGSIFAVSRTRCR